VHFLAHGVAIGTDDKRRFKLVLHSEDGNRVPVGGTDIAKALEPIIGKCSVVTFATCNGGNERWLRLSEQVFRLISGAPAGFRLPRSAEAG
jgi:hypothetical protein